MKTDAVLTRKTHSQQYTSVSLTGSSECSETEDGVLSCIGRNPISAECKVNTADTCMCLSSLLHVVYKVFIKATVLFSKAYMFISHPTLSDIKYLYIK